MKGRQIAIFGLGRSGLAVGKAALAFGARPQVFDETPEESISKRQILSEARTMGLPVHLSWDGQIPADTELLVVNPAVDMRHPKLREAVDRGIDVISEVEFAYRISRAPIVALTGTNGKSTTTVMTYLCLTASGKDAVLGGNIYGSGYDEVPLTEAAQKSKPGQVLVAEISSFQLEWVNTFRPLVAGITNITPDHQSRYDSFEQYAQTKRRIYAAQRVPCIAVVNADTTEVDHQPVGPTVWTYGSRGEEARLEVGGIRLWDRLIPYSVLPFEEPHNHANACLASLLAYGYLTLHGMPHDEAINGIVRGLRSFRGLSHRMEVVVERDGVLFINNSMCTNPDAIVKSMSSLRRPIHVLIGGQNKGLDFAPVKEFLAGTEHRAYLFGSSRDEINSMLGGHWPTAETMAEAFALAAGNATIGQAIMLAPGCASMDQFQDFRDRGNLFGTLAREWLRS